MTTISAFLSVSSLRQRRASGHHATPERLRMANSLMQGPSPDSTRDNSILPCAKVKIAYSDNGFKFMKWIVKSSDRGHMSESSGFALLNVSVVALNI